MILHSMTGMFDSWENVRAIHACIDAANSGTTIIQECQTQADIAFGLLLRANQYRLTDFQIVTGLLPKIAHVFFWIGGLIIGMVLYRSWKILLPLDEPIRSVRTPQWKKKK